MDRADWCAWFALLGMVPLAVFLGWIGMALGGYWANSSGRN